MTGDACRSEVELVTIEHAAVDTSEGGPPAQVPSRRLNGGSAPPITAER
jgi:hypothetical protein